MSRLIFSLFSVKNYQGRNPSMISPRYYRSKSYYLSIIDPSSSLLYHVLNLWIIVFDSLPD